MSRMTRIAGLAATAALLTGSVAPVVAQDAAPLEGELTLWHSYGSGAGTEADALSAALASERRQILRSRSG